VTDVGSYVTKCEVLVSGDGMKCSWTGASAAIGVATRAINATRCGSTRAMLSLRSFAAGLGVGDDADRRCRVAAGAAGAATLTAWR
jgi:hypothetical protein